MKADAETVGYTADRYYVPDGTPRRPTEAELDEIALEEDRKRVLEGLGLLGPADYARVRQRISDETETPLGFLDQEWKERRRAHTDAEKPDAAKFLEEPEPWDDPVDGIELLRDLVNTLQRYVILPEHAATAIALWIVHTHALRCFNITPILAIESPEKRCGKTTLLGILRYLVFKGLTASNLTAALAFRVVDAYQPTLVLDEADTFLTDDKSELRGILNSGHCRTAAFVPRCVGDDHDIKMFSTWCAKVIALIGELPATLQDRAIAILMKRRQHGEHVHRRRGDRVEDLHALCRKATRWAADHEVKIRACDPTVPDALDDRAADNWRPLLAIATVVGAEWSENAHAAALELSGSRSRGDHSPGVMLLQDIRKVLDVDWLTPTSLIDRLCALEEAPWGHWRHGKLPITGRAVRKLLEPYEIASKQTTIHGASAKRYFKSDFEDAWTRYLPSPEEAEKA